MRAGDFRTVAANYYVVPSQPPRREAGGELKRTKAENES